MCRDIIEAHHGRIRVDSTVGKGTAFTLKLPAVSKAAERPTYRRGPAVARAAGPAGEGVSVSSSPHEGGSRNEETADERG